MDCYFTLYHNTYGYSLLFYKVYIRRENAGSWNSGPGKVLSKIPILHISKCAEILTGFILECIKIIGEKKYQRGATHHPRGWGRPLPRGPPGSPLMPIFGYMKSFVEEKIIS